MATASRHLRNRPRPRLDLRALSATAYTCDECGTIGTLTRVAGRPYFEAPRYLCRQCTQPATVGACDGCGETRHVRVIVSGPYLGGQACPECWPQLADPAANVVFA